MSQPEREGHMSKEVKEDVYYSEKLNDVYHLLRNIGLNFTQSVKVVKELQKINVLPEDKKE